jgi:hypothetical protein
MPSATQVSSVSRTNSVVTIAADGIARFANATASRMQHEQHDPQSPMAVNTTSLSCVMLSINHSRPNSLDLTAGALPFCLESGPKAASILLFPCPGRLSSAPVSALTVFISRCESCISVDVRRWHREGRLQVADANVILVGALRIVTRL